MSIKELITEQALTKVQLIKKEFGISLIEFVK